MTRRCVCVVRIAILVATLALTALAVAPATDRVASGRGGEPLVRVGFGPGQIWQPSREAIGALQACQGGNYTCVRAAMLANGASEDAIQFFRLTGWFLSGLEGGDPVQLGRIFVPWRANENEQWALLGGVPAVVLPEREAAFEFGVRGDPEYRAIQAENPDVMFWGSGPSLEATEPSPAGGQRFIFCYALLDGCHACAVLGWARVAFDFMADGTYQGSRLLNVVRQSPAGP